MTIQELCDARPELRSAANIMIASGMHANDVVRALQALPDSSSAARPAATFIAPTYAPAPIAVRQRTAEELSAMWDRAMSRAMDAAGLMQTQPQPAMYDRTRPRNVSAMWDAAMAKAMGQAA